MATRGIYLPFIDAVSSVRRRWRDQGLESNLPDPAIYTQEDESLPELFKDVLSYLEKDAPILEIGCNVGRSLNYLYKKGV